ncbi:hypothetical protein HNO89_001979 [Sporosarcina luteola]|nr:hypothetical protein [Sporosarcina luteola]
MAVIRVRVAVQLFQGNILLSYSCHVLRQRQQLIFLPQYQTVGDQVRTPYMKQLHDYF